MDEDLTYQRVTGVSFYQRELEETAPGEAIKLVHEPDNPHDSMALRVETSSGRTLGYIPRRSALHAAIHQQGRGASGTVASIGYSRACILGATIAITLSDDLVEVRSYYPNEPAPEPPRGGFRYWVNTPAAASRLVAARR